jgi:predicted kinase
MFREPFIIIPVGIPCSGKTTLRGEYLEKYPDMCVISPDDIRMKILDYERTGIASDPSIEDEVWERAFNALARCTCMRKNIFFDATNLTVWAREQILDEIDDSYRKIAIFLDVPVSVALERLKNRERKVPEDRIRAMYAMMEEPSTCEGFDEVVTRQSC